MTRTTLHILPICFSSCRFIATAENSPAQHSRVGLAGVHAEHLRRDITSLTVTSHPRDLAACEVELTESQSSAWVVQIGCRRLQNLGYRVWPISILSFQVLLPCFPDSVVHSLYTPA